MVVEIRDNKTGEIYTYYMAPNIKMLLDKIKAKIRKKDQDYVMLIDGGEGTGKSTIAQQLGRYIDPSLNLDRVCMDADEFKKAILTAKKGQCVIYDEAVTGMTAGSSITRIGRLLKSLMMQMRQQNLFVIVILPSVFEFNKYAVLSRARWFFHIYESKGRLGYFVGYNKKDLRRLYLDGKKTYSYRIRTTFTGRFYGKYTIPEKPYRKKKREALKKIDEEDEGSHRWLRQRDICVYLLYKLIKNNEKVAKALTDVGFKISKPQVSRITAKQRGASE